MVLHNNKWDRKAKRANERRKGITHHKSGPAVHIAGRLPVDRDLDSAPDADEDSQESSTDDSFEFDSDEEGKTEKEKREIRAAKALVPPNVPNDIPKVGPAVPRKQTEQVTEVDIPNGTTVTQKSSVDRQFRRRRLYDNSSRYEENIDPYLEKEKSSEEDFDFLTVPTREYENPNKVETIPDETQSIRQKSFNPEDRSQFEALKHIQQKEEYARDMRRRFGNGRHQTRNDENPINDDAFFQEMLLTPQGSQAQSVSTLGRSHTSIGTQDPQSSLRETARHEEEQFLDDLLKL